MNPLINEFKKYGEISNKIENELNQHIKIIYKNKGDFFLKPKQIISNVFMLKKGLVRAFFEKEGKEVNTWFGMEDELLGSLLPTFSQQPSFEYIQFLEDSLIYAISTADLNKLYENHPEFNLIGRKVAERICVIMEKRILSLHTETPEERYKNLIQNQPEILQKVNLGHIASYLGITQETLSRIRSRI